MPLREKGGQGKRKGSGEGATTREPHQGAIPETRDRAKFCIKNGCSIGRDGEGTERRGRVGGRVGEHVAGWLFMRVLRRAFTSAAPFPAPLPARRLNPEKVMSRAVSSAPWGLARWCLAVVPTPLGGGGARTTASCPGKCSEHEIPRQPVTSGASTGGARREAEVLPATTTPPRPSQQPTGPVLRGERCSRRPHAPPASLAASSFIRIQT